MLKKDKVVISLCAPPRCRCPEMELNFENHEVIIKDDYNGSARVTFSEMTVLAQRFLEHV